MGGKQLSFADALSDPRLGANRRLEAIGAAIDWAPLAALSARLGPGRTGPPPYGPPPASFAARLRPGQTGRPPYEPLVMLKALLLQRLYALSDPQLEEALFDRLSFRRFCGFAAGPAACRQGPDPQDRHADRRHDHRRQEPQARARRRPWGASSFRARRRLDEEERPLPFRLSPPCRRRRGLGPYPPARADPGQSEREPRRRRPHLRRRARRLWRQGLREQGAPRPAQGAR